MLRMIALCSLLLTACAPLAPTSPSDQAQAMVVTANPLASEAGAEVLRRGGSAVDAAIAIESVLSLVEPQSSGMAGGGFMVHFDRSSKGITIYDGRETAPQNATPSMFLNEKGEPMGFIAAKTSGMSTGVPGMVSMLKMAHADYGRLAWGEHFFAAIEHAENGFNISPRLAGMISRFQKYIPKKAQEGPVDAYEYFFDDSGQPLQAGDVLKNPAYAQALRLIGEDADNFYRGEIAEEIISQVLETPRAGGMQLDDLANFRAIKRQAICAPYRSVQLCGPPPPSSWIAVAMTMGLIERSPGFSADAEKDPRNWAIFSEAQRLAYADRDRYVADSDVVDVPLAALLSSEYLDRRAASVTWSEAQPVMRAGNPQVPLQKVAGIDATVDHAGTTHFVVVDAQGDVVSMTASVESIFGSTRMAYGMFLNNQLTDFSFRAKDSKGRQIANAVGAGKRPRSSMSPTIVLDDDGEFLVATGSPGGNSIIAYTAKSLVGMLDWGLSPQDAVDLPNVVARGKSVTLIDGEEARDNTVRIERSRATDELLEGMRNFGFQVKESAGENSGLSVVFRSKDGSLIGGADSRREGKVISLLLPKD